jgi:hypothetical protein
MEREYGGVLKGLRSSDKRQHSTDSNDEEKLRKTLDGKPLHDLINSSVWGLKGGLETLIVALREWLGRKPNVILKSAESIQSVDISPDSPSKVSFLASGVSGATRVLSSQAELDSMYRLLPLVGCTNTSII